VTSASEAAGQVRSWSPASKSFLRRFASRDVDLPRLRERTLALAQRLVTIQSESARCDDEVNALSSELGRQEVLLPERNTDRLDELEARLTAIGIDGGSEESRGDLRDILDATRLRLAEEARLAQMLASRKAQEAERAAYRRDELSVFIEQRSTLRATLAAYSEAFEVNDQATQYAWQYAEAESRRLHMVHNTVALQLASRKLLAEMEVMTAVISKLE
jgi:hypothetical protein